VTAPRPGVPRPGVPYREPRVERSAGESSCGDRTRATGGCGSPRLGGIDRDSLRRLADAALHADALLVFGVGGGVDEGALLAGLWGGDLREHALRAAVIRGAERSFDQDPCGPSVTVGRHRFSAAVFSGQRPRYGGRRRREPDPRAGPPETRHRRHRRHRRGLRRAPGWPGAADLAELPAHGVADRLSRAARIPMVLERLQRLLSLLEMSSPPRHGPLIRLTAQVHDRLMTCRAAPVQEGHPHTAGNESRAACGPRAGRAEGRR
jgi:hypothetical protein